MPEGVCPYEVSANWACLDSDFASTTVLAKDGKPLGMIAFLSIKDLSDISLLIVAAVSLDTDDDKMT